MFARLLLLFVTVPLIELILFMKIGAQIGITATVAIIIITAVTGAWLTRIEGLRTLARFRQATAEGRLPHEEVMDGLMILIAAALLLTPGFLTDAVGFLLLVPPFRVFVRRRVAQALKKHIRIVGGEIHATTAPPGATRRNTGERVVEARVIDRHE